MKPPRTLLPLAPSNRWRTALLAALLLALPLPAGAEETWTHDATDQGVEVSTRTEAGRNLPIFRGVGTIDAGVFEILAVMDDIAHYTEWMSDCSGARIVKQINEFERIEYNRIAAPWPVSDRDTTLRSWVEASARKKDVWARFESVTVPEAGPVSGVVRMPRLAGFYHLEPIDAGHTKVTYQVDADPGGLLPDWLVKLTSRKLPIQTLVGLRRQVTKTRGQHEAFLADTTPARAARSPNNSPSEGAGGPGHEPRQVDLPDASGSTSRRDGSVMNRDRSTSRTRRVDLPTRDGSVMNRCRQVDLPTRRVDLPNRDGSVMNRDRSTSRRDGSVMNRDRSTSRRDGSTSHCRPGSVMNRDRSTSRRDGSVMNRDRSTSRRDGSTSRRDGSVMNRDRSTSRRDGSTSRRDGSTSRRDGSVINRDGSWIGSPARRQTRAGEVWRPVPDCRGPAGAVNTSPRAASTCSAPSSSTSRRCT